MSIDISKLCSDYLRNSFSNELKASHARELVAAFFGYKSHAALLAEKKYPLSQLEEANILVPAVLLMDERRRRLRRLPTNLPSSYELSARLCTYLQDERFFSGDVWLYESLKNYIMEEFLVENDAVITEELSGTMAETNAYFDDAYYESATVSDNADDVTVEVEGTYNGTTDPDKPFCGDKIDMSVTVTLYRIAGRAGFWGSEISARGSVNDDWVDPEVYYSSRPSL